ncbi:MAG: hypothetical protein H6Q64_819, partial [Firmicutes bacterium]|nr:hypothetical protein [Bacillota bacterium]
MDDYKVIEVKQNILGKNDRQAKSLRE